MFKVSNSLLAEVANASHLLPKQTLIHIRLDIVMRHIPKYWNILLCRQ